MATPIYEYPKTELEATNTILRIAQIRNLWIDIKWHLKKESLEPQKKAEEYTDATVHCDCDNVTVKEW